MSDKHWKADVLLAGDWRGATTVLLSNGHRRMLVDTGMSHNSHQVLAALAERGLEPDKIDVVISTHFHIDHVLNNCLFEQSQFYATQQSYEWCCAMYHDIQNESNWRQLVLKYYPETLEYERADQMMGKLRNLAMRWWDVDRLGPVSRYHWLEKEGLPDGMDFFITHGHVPGHASLLLEGTEQPIVIAGDALMTRDAGQFVLTMIPQNRCQAQADRGRVLALKGLIIPGHDRPFVHNGAVVATGCAPAAAEM